MNLIKPYFILANCILIALTAYLLVKGAYDLAAAGLGPTLPVVAGAKEKAAPSPVQRKPRSQYQPIEKRNLFKIKTETPEKQPEPENIEALEPTELKLRLKGTGTMAGSGNENSYAVIEDLTARSENLYRQGDTVQNAVIKKVLREKVILQVNDKDEILEMEKSETASSDVASPPAPARSRPPLRSTTRTRKITLERAQIDEALGNVNELMQQVRIMPHFDNGQPDGFRLSGIRTNSLIRKMGLRNGDIITGVNGQPIQTMDDALGFYKQLSGASEVSVDYKRRGRNGTIEYNIK